MLSAVASAVAIATPSIADPHPDADLIGLGRRWLSLRAACDAAQAAFNEVYDAYKARQPQKPEAMRYQPYDYELGLHPGGDPPGYLMPGPCDDLRKKSWALDATDMTPPDIAAVVARTAERRTRRQAEIVDAYDRWKAECDALSAELGVQPASDRLAAAYAPIEEVEEAIFAAEATSLAGCAVKARVLARQIWIDSGKEQPEDLADQRGLDLAQDIIRASERG
jgi:hypothetical protein